MQALCLFHKASAQRVFLPLTSCFPSSPALSTHLGSRNKANCPQDFLQSEQDEDTSAPEIYHHLQGTATHYPCQQLTEISQQDGQLGFRKQAGYALRHTAQGGWYSPSQTRASTANYCVVGAASHRYQEGRQDRGCGRIPLGHGRCSDPHCLPLNLAALLLFVPLSQSFLSCKLQLLIVLFCFSLKAPT